MPRRTGVREAATRERFDLSSKHRLARLVRFFRDTSLAYGAGGPGSIPGAPIQRRLVYWIARLEITP
jgi:hypothetical protein